MHEIRKYVQNWKPGWLDYQTRKTVRILKFSLQTVIYGVLPLTLTGGSARGLRWGLVHRFSKPSIFSESQIRQCMLNVSQNKDQLTIQQRSKCVHGAKETAVHKLTELVGFRSSYTQTSVGLLYDVF